MHLPPTPTTLPANATVRLRLALRRGPMGVPLLVPRVIVANRRTDLLG